MPGVAEAAVRSHPDILAVDSDVGEDAYFGVLWDAWAGDWANRQPAKPPCERRLSAAPPSGLGRGTGECCYAANSVGFRQLF